MGQPSNSLNHQYTLNTDTMTLLGSIPGGGPVDFNIVVAAGAPLTGVLIEGKRSLADIAGKWEVIASEAGDFQSGGGANPLVYSVTNQQSPWKYDVMGLRGGCTATIELDASQYRRIRVSATGDNAKATMAVSRAPEVNTIGMGASPSSTMALIQSGISCMLPPAGKVLNSTTGQISWTAAITGYNDTLGWMYLPAGIVIADTWNNGGAAGMYWTNLSANGAQVYQTYYDPLTQTPPNMQSGAWLDNPALLAAVNTPIPAQVNADIPLMSITLPAGVLLLGTDLYFSALWSHNASNTVAKMFKFVMSTTSGPYSLSSVSVSPGANTVTGINQRYTVKIAMFGQPYRMVGFPNWSSVPTGSSGGPMLSVPFKAEESVRFTMYAFNATADAAVSWSSLESCQLLATSSFDRPQ